VEKIITVTLKEACAPSIDFELPDPDTWTADNKGGTIVMPKADGLDVYRMIEYVRRVAQGCGPLWPKTTSAAPSSGADDEYAQPTTSAAPRSGR